MALNAGVLAWLAGALLTGEGVGRLLRLEAGSWWERLSRNYGLGLIATSLSLFWLSLLGVPLMLGSLLGTTLFWSLAGWLGGKSVPSAPLAELTPVARILLAVTALLGIFIVIASLAGPETSLDGRTHWGMCARMLWYEKSVWGETFWNPDRLFPHRRYPLHIPLSEWSVFAYCGECDARTVKAIFSLVWVAQAGLLWGQLCRMHTPQWAAGLLLLWTGLPFPAFSQDGGAVSGYSDLSLTLFTTGAFIAVVRKRPLEFFVWSAGALFCKREGLPLIGLAAVLLLLSPERRFWWRSLCLVALVILPWWIFVHNLPSDHLGASAITGRATTTAVALWGPHNFLRIAWQIGFEPRTWALLWWVFASGILSRARWSRTSWMGLLFALGYAPVLMMVFLPVSPEVYDWNTVNRTLLPLSGIALLFAASRLASREEHGETT